MKIKINKNMIVLGDQAVFSGGSFLLTVALAKILGIQNFGIYASLTLFNYGVVSLLNAVIINPMQVSLERVSDKKNYLSFNFWSLLSILIALILLLLLTLQFKFEILSSIRTFGIAPIIYFAGFVLQDYFRKLFLAEAAVIKAFAIDSISTLLSFVVVCFAWFHPGFSLYKILVYLSISYIPSMLLSIYWSNLSLKNWRNWNEFLNFHLKQGKWLLITTITQWWASNLFIVSSGVLLGVQALGAFRLVQSLFGVLNIVLQTLENYALPEAARLFISSSADAKKYLKTISSKSGLLFGLLLLVLFIFSKEVILLAGNASYLEYAYLVKGMCILYAFIFIGYPIRIAIRMLVLNRVYFTGYLLSLLFSLTSYQYLLQHWNVSGAIAGLIFSQLIVLCYWQYILIKKQFILWK